MIATAIEAFAALPWTGQAILAIPSAVLAAWILGPALVGIAMGCEWIAHRSGLTRALGIEP